MNDTAATPSHPPALPRPAAEGPPLDPAWLWHSPETLRRRWAEGVTARISVLAGAMTPLAEALVHAWVLTSDHESPPVGWLARQLLVQWLGQHWPAEAGAVPDPITRLQASARAELQASGWSPLPTALLGEFQGQEPQRFAVLEAAARRCMAEVLAPLYVGQAVQTGCPVCGSSTLRIDLHSGTDATVAFYDEGDDEWTSCESVGGDGPEGPEDGFDAGSQASCTCGAHGLMAGMLRVGPPRPGEDG